jgi:hypothetical protein
MPKHPNTHERPAYRDDAATQAIVGLFDDIDWAQALVYDGKPATARVCVAQAVQRFKTKVDNTAIKDLTIGANALGRLEVYIHYVDDLGTYRTTYTARSDA